MASSAAGVREVFDVLSRAEHNIERAKTFHRGERPPNKRMQLTRSAWARRRGPPRLYRCWATTGRMLTSGEEAPNPWPIVSRSRTMSRPVVAGRTASVRTAAAGWRVRAGIAGCPADKATIEHLNREGPFYWSGGLVEEHLVIACGRCNASRVASGWWTGSPRLTVADWGSAREQSRLESGSICAQTPRSVREPAVDETRGARHADSLPACARCLADWMPSSAFSWLRCCLPLVLGPIVAAYQFLRAGQYVEGAAIALLSAACYAVGARAVARGEFGPGTVFTVLGLGAVILYLAIWFRR